jgi:CubicO group peptidase (beta-lactamase class C family)
MDNNLQTQALDIINEYINNNEENAVQFCVFKEGKCIINAFSGYMDFERQKKIDEHSLFPIYSASKAFPATIINMLIEEGLVSEEDYVAKYWPTFACNGKEKTKVLHFLNHTSGLPQRFIEMQTYDFVANWNSMIKVIEDIKPDWVPGTKTRYQSLTYGWVTSELIKRITNKSFAANLQEKILKVSNLQDDIIFGLTSQSEQRAVDFKVNGPKTCGDTICDPLDDLMRSKVIREAVLPGFNGFASAWGLANFYNDLLYAKYISSNMLKRALHCQVPEFTEKPKLNSFIYFANGYILSGQANNISNVFGHGGYGGADGLVNIEKKLVVAFTSSILGGHPLKTKLFDLVNFTQREDWVM